MSLRLPALGEHLRPSPTWGLGLNLELPRAGTFGVAGIAEMPPKSSGPTPIFGFDLIRSTAPQSDVLRPIVAEALSSASTSRLTPPSGAGIALLELAKDGVGIKAKLDIIATVVDAVLSGKELASDIAKAEAAGQSRQEAVACETIKALTKGILGSTFEGAISAGIPVYLAAARLDPRIFATLPVVLPLLPYAYKGAEGTATFIGSIAGKACHISIR